MSTKTVSMSLNWPGTYIYNTASKGISFFIYMNTIFIKKLKPKGPINTKILEFIDERKTIV